MRLPEAATIALDALRRAAVAALPHSYSPYSNFPVGVAGFTDDGRLVWGANIENASYGLTLCAECSLVSDLIRHGGGRVVALSVVAGDGEPIAPCGRCRQVLFEHGGAALVIDQGDGEPLTLADLLPRAFGPDDLPTRSTP